MDTRGPPPRAPRVSMPSRSRANCGWLRHSAMLPWRNRKHGSVSRFPSPFAVVSCHDKGLCSGTGAVQTDYQCDVQVAEAGSVSASRCCSRARPQPTGCFLRPRRLRLPHGSPVVSTRSKLGTGPPAPNLQGDPHDHKNVAHRAHRRYLGCRPVAERGQLHRPPRGHLEGSRNRSDH